MGGLVQGAALGAAFDLLFISVLEATQKIARFSSELNRLKSTLCSIKLVIDDIDNFNKILDRPQHETQVFVARLIEGEKLVQRCSKVKWNVFMRLYYSIKLSKLEASLVNFFQINVAALHFRESKRISVVVSNLEEKINEIMTVLKKSEIGGCNFNCLQEIVVGDEKEMLQGIKSVSEPKDSTLLIYARSFKLDLEARCLYESLLCESLLPKKR
ncbi:hypothetical protein DH2020_049965 [Rehmannia glutinosa]|uniref:RPW8 domain-containing protein n=1 Tax=Rehmannia glutinosa TaxID=99300 RepID=A0ABR0U1C2_REHGL